MMFNVAPDLAGKSCCCGPANTQKTAVLVLYGNDVCNQTRSKRILSWKPPKDNTWKPCWTVSAKYSLRPLVLLITRVLKCFAVL